ncbi:hypothetical protein PHYBLDRAFT_172371 [Phycomyces blakesleeanus NRRL 1555(-)]|uniref:Uncharacterized protein n=1 Tax=Phycomyces blakesleeanus (strain ATCC 8743b / DSM 1359 / FGSC 10004 / NBRC 33097 / NRRL 1555) TaxID=763407 RepID=A0A167KXL6_PHYB8|nr:hypothetical protein PHYBLDRAFT_172371 [Phycomyces blakesleeanus NRRL 1555(-)]OAD69118.1 hypothetical protein PHYBLDRAFT_172371 [Phycomyces blakesleeanus NRRL 1555(-)]|eukprot:XP_018287158.1 hypothetical protein PHYBLDRAFT_172371 [Phycomyces blakesleeanus NRRL 1555(-)]
MLDGLLGNKIILTLALSKVNVAFNCNAMKSIKRSSPQSFTVIGSLITLDVLRYLSFQCRVLNELRLSVHTKYLEFVVTIYALKKLTKENLGSDLNESFSVAIMLEK